VIGLDTKNNVGFVDTVYSGSLNTTVVRIAEVLRMAVIMNCASIILVHNHPSGDPTPSPEDVSVTEMVKEAAGKFDITVLDHLVIGKNRYMSLKEKGLGFS
jgi:DNA repair protein RadC